MAVVVPTLPELFEEAFERAGLEMQTGYELQTAVRSLNLMLLEWQNRGYNLFMVDSGTLALSASTASYDMPIDTIDVIEHQIRLGTGTSQVDYALTRISGSEYAAQSVKNTTGRPSQIYVDRASDGVRITLWPVPDQAYTLYYQRMKGLDGLASGIGTTAGIPPRFVPALEAGLAYRIAGKKVEATDRVMALKADYEEQFALAASEDESRASFHVTPDMRGYR